ncbi:MAG: phosphoribosylamine--glycine ligase [Saccharofermentanales bacterium]
MKILVVGGGGREHTIVWKLAQSRHKPMLFCAPGNAGIAGIAECVPIKATEIIKITEFAIKEKIDLVFVAPDDPLAMGLVNMLQDNGIRAFGPTSQAAVLEASKSFSKNLMDKYRIPTANYKVFEEKGSAFSHIDTLTPPVVIKADGLALGKGVIIAQTLAEAKDAVEKMLSGEAFGESGRTVLIEEFLTGRELTVLAFTDGETVVPMPNSRDHKKALDHDEGLNTGGMGAICPGEDISLGMARQMHETIFQPTVDAMRNEGRIFKGVIYFGLMLTEDGPKVIEYNARFGDPETQAVLPLLETDFVDIIDAVIDGRLGEIDIRWSGRSSCCVVIASGGYPGAYETGYPITGLDKTDCLVFHAGTRFSKDTDRRIVTSGGRVLGITGIADDIQDAISIAYRNVDRIHFNDMHFRRDIGMTK